MIRDAITYFLTASKAANNFDWFWHYKIFSQYVQEDSVSYPQ